MDVRAAGGGTVEVAVAALVRLLRDEDGPVRDQARDALGTVGGAAAVRPLLGELAAAVGSRQRVAVVARHLAPDDVTAILERLAADEDPRVRDVAAGQQRRT